MQTAVELNISVFRVYLFKSDLLYCKNDTDDGNVPDVERVS